MVRSTLLTLVAAASTLSHVIAGPVVSRPDGSRRYGVISVEAAIPQRAPAPDTVSSHVLRLQKSSSGVASKSSRMLRAMASNGKSGSSSGITRVNNTQDVEYTAVIDWAGTPVTVIVDTGSSDTWLVQKDFQCLSEKGKPRAVSLAS